MDLSVFQCGHERQEQTPVWRNPRCSSAHFLPIGKWQLVFMWKWPYCLSSSSAPNYHSPLVCCLHSRTALCMTLKNQLTYPSWHMSEMRIVPRQVKNSYKLVVTKPSYYSCDFLKAKIVLKQKLSGSPWTAKLSTHSLIWEETSFNPTFQTWSAHHFLSVFLSCRFSDPAKNNITLGRC